MAGAALEEEGAQGNGGHADALGEHPAELDIVGEAQRSDVGVGEIRARGWLHREADVREPRAKGRDMVIDRREAIEAALAEVQSGDIVVVAGKGHEDYQLVGGRVLEFDDRVIIREWIERNRTDG